MRQRLLPALLVALILGLAACGGTVARFEIQFACLHRSLEPCVAAEEFAERVSERTNELVRITITSISELGRIDLESDPWQEDGTFRLMEIHSDHLGPLVDMDNLWGSYGDYETQLRVTEAIREDVERSIEEKTGGVVLAYLFYPSNYYFSNRPLRTAADMGGLRTRTFLPSGKYLFDQQSHTNVSRDLLDGMGAISVSKSYTQVYEELRKNNLDAAVSCSACGSNIAWYEVADYLVGPIVALSHSWIIVSRERWASLPQEIQVVIREEAKLLEETTRRNALTVWDQQGVEDNIAGGMEYIELTPELNALARQAALTNVLPKWVERAGGPQSEAALIYNAKVAPIVKMEITGEGEARDLE